MSHEIEFKNGAHSFAYAGLPTWHSLGHKVPSDLTPEQMLNAASLNWKVKKIPAYAEVAGKRIMMVPCQWKLQVHLRVVRLFSSLPR